MTKFFTVEQTEGTENYSWNFREIGNASAYLLGLVEGYKSKGIELHRDNDNWVFYNFVNKVYLEIVEQEFVDGK